MNPKFIPKIAVKAIGGVENRPGVVRIYFKSLPTELGFCLVHFFELGDKFYLGDHTIPMGETHDVYEVTGKDFIENSLFTRCVARQTFTSVLTRIE